MQRRLTVLKKEWSWGLQRPLGLSLVYSSKITDASIQLLPAAYELPGRWGEGFVSVIRKASNLASRNGRNDDGLFPVIWKRKIMLAAHRTMFLHAHALMQSSHLPVARFGMDVDDDILLA